MAASLLPFNEFMDLLMLLLLAGLTRLLSVLFLAFSLDKDSW